MYRRPYDCTVNIGSLIATIRRSVYNDTLVLIHIKSLNMALSTERYANFLTELIDNLLNTFSVVV